MKRSTIAISPLLLGFVTTSQGTEVFFTDFEEAPNSKTGFTAGPLDGWSTYDEAIEYWYHTTGDSSQPVNGNFIELNKATQYDSAEDIYRNIDTIKGVEYRLSFIYSGRPSYSAAVNSIEIRVDGTTIGSYSDNASNRSDNNWQTANLTFTGTGASQEILIKNVGTTVASGRGMRIDGIRLEYTSHDISVTKTDSKTTYQPGESSSYTITVTNNGPDNAQDIDINDTLPSGVELSGSWSCSAPAGSACSTNSGGSSGGTSLSLTADIENGDAITITVPVAYSTDPADY